jgi:hypothetical protein
VSSLRLTKRHGSSLSSVKTYELPARAAERPSDLLVGAAAELGEDGARGRWSPGSRAKSHSRARSSSRVITSPPRARWRARARPGRTSSGRRAAASGSDGERPHRTTDEVRANSRVISASATRNVCCTMSSASSPEPSNWAQESSSRPRCGTNDASKARSEPPRPARPGAGRRSVAAERRYEIRGTSAASRPITRQLLAPRELRPARSHRRRAPWAHWYLSRVRGRWERPGPEGRESYVRKRLIAGSGTV